MAEENVRQKVDQLKTDVEYADESRVVLENPDDFASEVNGGLERAAVSLEGIDNPAIRDKYLPKIEDRVRGFLQEVDPGNYEALADQLVSDLDSIIGEADTDRRVETKKKEKLSEMAKGAETAADDAEQIEPLAISGEDFDVSTPAGIVSAFDKLCALEQSVAETGRQMADAFQGAYSKVEQANNYASEAGITDYLKTWIPGVSNNPHAASAQSATESAKQVFSEKLAEFERAQNEIENKSKTLLSASEKLLQKTASDVRSLESEKGKADVVVPEAEKQHREAERQLDRLSGGKDQMGTDLQEVIEKYAEQIAELQKKIDELSTEKQKLLADKAQHEEARAEFLREKEGKYDSANDEQKAILDAEDRRLAEISADLESGLAQIDSDIASLHASLNSLKEKQAEAELQYDEGISETDSMIEEVSGAEEQISDQEVDARVASELLDESLSEKRVAEKGMTEVTAGIRESSSQWSQNNKQMQETLLQQSVMLDNVKIDEPKFFRNFVYNVPVIGKYGVLGLVGGIGKGLSWAVSQLWTDNFEESYQENIEMARNIPVVGFFAGIFDGCKNIVSGLGHVVAHPEQALDGINLLLNPWNWVTEGKQIVEVGKALIQYDEFAKGNVQFGIGRIAPDVLLTIATCGGGAAGKVASMGGRISQAFRAGRAAATGGRILGRAAGLARGVGSAAVAVGKEAVGIAVGSARIMGKITWEVITSPKYVARLFKGIASKMTAKEMLIFMRHGKKGLAQRVVGADAKIAKLKQLAGELDDAKTASLYDEIAATQKDAAYTEGILNKSGVVSESIPAIASKPSIFTRAGRGFTRIGDRVRDFRTSWFEKDLAWVDSEIAKTKSLIPESEAGLAPGALKMKRAHEARLKGLEGTRKAKLGRMRDAKLTPLRRQHAELLDMKKSLSEAGESADVAHDMALVDSKIAEVTAEMKKLGIDLEAEAAATAKAAAASEAVVAKTAETAATEVAFAPDALTVEGRFFKKYRDGAGKVVELERVKWRNFAKKRKFRELGSSYKGKIFEGSDGKFYGIKDGKIAEILPDAIPATTAAKPVATEAAAPKAAAEPAMAEAAVEKFTGVTDAELVRKIADLRTRIRKKGGAPRGSNAYFQLTEMETELAARRARAAGGSTPATEAAAPKAAVAPEIAVSDDAVRAAKTDFDIPALRDRLRTPLKRPKQGLVDTMSEHSHHIREIREWKTKLVDEMRTADEARLAVLRERYMDLVNLEREFYAQSGMDAVRGMVGKGHGISPELRKYFVETVDAARDGVLDARVVEVLRDPRFATIVSENSAAFRQALRTVAEDWRIIPPDFQYVLVAKDMNIAQRVMALCAMVPELYPMLKGMTYPASAEAVERYFRAAAATAN